MCNNSTPGPNGLTGGQPGYMLTDGYDEVTGLGSLDISSFAANYHPAPTIKILRTPPALTFDTRIVGTSQTEQFDVLNTGASKMDTLAITFTGPNAGDFSQTNNCPSQLGWDISCTIQVTFTPSATGTRTATLTVASDNAVNSPKQVSLTGAGTTTLATPFVGVSAYPYITTIDPDQVFVNVYASNGYSTPTGSITLTGPGINFAATTLTNGSVTFNIPAGVLPVGNDVLTAVYAPDAASSSIYNSATATDVVTVSVFKPTPVVTVTPSLSTVTTYQAFSVTVNVSGGSGNPNPTGNVWATVGAYGSNGNHLTNGSVTINVPPGTVGSAGPAYITINVDGDDNYTPSSGGAAFNVINPIGSFTFSAPSVTIAPGATTGNSTIVTITPSGGFTGSISLNPTITSSPAKSQNPPSLSFGTTPTITFTDSSPITATLYVFTTAPTRAALTTSQPLRRRWYATGGATLAGILFLWVPRRRRNLRNVLGAIVLLAFLTTGVLACSGGTTSINNNNSDKSGTTPGSYAITITGTSGPITASATVNLTVQ
jgi:hypothetical protein